ncbi:family 78 glycoside hydrolase catalytic domain [Paenibacillus sp. MBLB4367]|uniref:family 78 glycoside hydrolase catalytic domain n=1 Tax=Paenibacillus sp. MBLB4367 TaxID=3384767 RepID=UPI0039084179
MAFVTKLRCEYKENPIGIDIRHPRISWQIQSDTRSWLQAAYQIQISQDLSFETLLWDSAKVQTDQSVHVGLAAMDWRKGERYHYRVKVWSDRGVETEWSKPAFWEMGLLDSKDWQAEWIGAPAGSWGAESCPLLRRAFRVNSPVKRARIYATGLGLYEMHLNGRRVGDSYFTPGWTSYKHRLQYQTYDVTEQMVIGDNALGAVLGNGWYKGKLTGQHKPNVYGERTAFLMQLHLEYENGAEEVIVTDSGWKTAESPILMSELYEGETYDARLERIDWSTPGYDDAEWLAADTLPYAKETLLAQENEPVRKIEEIFPVALLKTPSGETVVDMGQNMVGWVRFQVQGRSGQEVTLQHAEVLDRDGNFYTDNLRKAKQTVRYVLKGGQPETYEPRFTFQGFRYVKLTGFGEDIQLAQFTGIVLHSDMERTGDFQCSDPLVNQLQHNILWGQKGNFLDVPTDCPQRDERLGWTGDAQMFIRTSAHLMNVAPFFTKWLHDLAADQLSNGGVPFVIPHVLGENSHSSAAWGDAAVICPWVIYQCYGDKRILEQQYGSMKAWVEYIRNQGENACLWNTGFHFGDWLGLDSKPDSYIGATDRDFIATAYYAYSVSLLAKTAKVLQITSDFERYTLLHAQIRDAFQQEFVTPRGRLSVSTQTANVLALLFGLVDGKAEERAVQKLLELLEESKFHLTTGFVGTPYLNLALSQAGHTEAAYKLLFQTDYPSWLYPITKGATTIWEHWDGIKEDGSFWSEHMNSFNHYAYGAVGEWLYRCVAGIDADEEAPGYKHVHMKPQPGEGLTWAEATLESMYGRIHAAWRRSDDHSMEIRIRIPPNTTASVHLPNAKAAMVRENGTTLELADGIHVIKPTVSGVSLTLGSGTYCFAY